jgi:hypothetical protein
MNSKTLISDEYRAMQKDLHKNPNYGVASLGFAPIIGKLISLLNVRSLSDYGAGKKNLLKGLSELGQVNFTYHAYDPAFPEYGEPKSADLVCCIDVLEHIEPDLLENVLTDLATITESYGFFSVHTGPAIKFLSDGRNAHLIQKQSSWWLKHLTNYFEVLQLQTLPSNSGFWVLVKPIKMN